jgi:hypothetical protein
MIWKTFLKVSTCYYDNFPAVQYSAQMTKKANAIVEEMVTRWVE